MVLVECSTLGERCCRLPGCEKWLAREDKTLVPGNLIQEVVTPGPGLGC